jgi:hypothetical protein
MPATKPAPGSSPLQADCTRNCFPWPALDAVHRHETPGLTQKSIRRRQHHRPDDLGSVGRGLHALGRHKISRSSSGLQSTLPHEFRCKCVRYNLRGRVPLTIQTAPAAGRASPPSAAHRFDAAAFAAGGKACKPRILGIGADSGHHEHRSPQHERGNRRERMTVDLLNRPARAAARAEHIEPGRPFDRRGPYRPRAARPTACGKGSVNFAFGDVLIAENVPEAQALV